MTEEIIIDGVDVAGCEFYLQDEKYSCDLSFINQEELCKCDDVQDCTYKQLKRLEFELKVTKADYEASEQENKETKSALEEIRNDIMSNKSVCTECIKIAKQINEVLQ